MRRYVLLPFLVLTPALLAPARPAASEDGKLTELFKAYLDRELRARPLEATRLGDHRFDGELDDVSPKARAGWAKNYRDTLAELKAKVDRTKLTRDGQIDLEVFEHDLSYKLWLAENTSPYEADPLVYNEYLTDSVYLLLTQSSLPRATNVKNAAARIAHIPRLIKQAKATLKAPPRVYAETAVLRNRGAVTFYESGIYELAGESPKTSELKRPADQAVAALKDYQVWLEKALLPRATGEWRLGRKKFPDKLVRELNSGKTAGEVLREAEAEFARVTRDMYVVARQLWGKTFPGKPLPPDDEAGRRATITGVLGELNKDHGQEAGLVKDVRATVERIKAFIEKKDVLRLPKPDRCKIVEMPEFQRGFSMAYLNPAPPLDAKAASYYAVSPPPAGWDARRRESYLQEYNRAMLQVLTIHEAYPGHYVQLEYSNRHPSVIRRVLQSGIFSEGWAVYTEQMMLDQGYGDGDLALRLNQLKFYLRAVTNAILDHKMHCENMSDEEAVKLMTERAFQSEGEAVAKVVRAKLSSCQLSTYFVGRMAFYDLRQKVQREMGDRFDLGRYHEAVLGHGTLPVKYLPEVVRARLKKPR